MRLHRFIGNFNLGSRNIRVTDPELFNQIRKVLRLEKGDEAILCDGNLNEARVRLIDIGKDFIVFEVTESMKNINEPERNVILYCAVLKKENFELVVQKATEIGVKEIVPLITARTVKLDIRKDRLEKIIREAAEQSGRGIVPALHDPVKFEDAIKKVRGNNLNLIFDQSGEMLDYSKLETKNHELLTVFVGPEGGWSHEELDLAKDNDFKMISLGKTTLRGETAAIISVYWAIHSF